MCTDSADLKSLYTHAVLANSNVLGEGYEQYRSQIQGIFKTFCFVCSSLKFEFVGRHVVTFDFAARGGAEASVDHACDLVST